MRAKYKLLRSEDISLTTTESFLLSTSSSARDSLSSVTSRNRSSNSISSDVPLRNLNGPPSAKSTSPDRPKHTLWNRGLSVPELTQAQASSSTNTTSVPHQASTPDKKTRASSQENVLKWQRNKRSEPRGKSKSPEETARLRKSGSSSPLTRLERALWTFASVPITSTGIIPTSPGPNPSPTTNASPIPATNANAQQTKLRDELNFELISKVGPTKSKKLVERHVKRSHFLLLNADEEADQEMADRIRCLLEKTNLGVSGRWNILPGEVILDAWQRLVDSATTVIVILSRAVYKDVFLSLCYPEALLREQAIVPLFLEPFTDNEVETDIPPLLRSIRFKNGGKLYDKNCNIEIYVRQLHSTFNYNRHYEQEIKAFVTLLENFESNTDYVCPCGRCLE